MITGEFDVLELRIHGVNNTSPAGMLELPETEIVESAGDTLGSFWRPRPAAQAAIAEGDPGRVPAGVTREAYSWGGMARNSVGGSSGIGKIISGGARLGWTLLIPFSLLNMAYWSRRLMKDGDVAHSRWYDAGGASAIRLSALLLTLLMSMTASVVSLDVVSVQCYADPDAPCSNLPSFMDFLKSWDVSRRLALMSLVPVAMVALLYLLTNITRVRYSQTTSAARAWQENHQIDAAQSSPVWPMLSTKGFWNPVRLLAQTSRLHLAAVAILVSLITAWHSTFGTGPACENPSRLFGTQCRAQVGDAGARAGTELGVAAACVVILVVIAVQVMRLSEDSADIAAATHRHKHHIGTSVVVGLAALAFLGQLAILTAWRTHPSGAQLPPELLGVSALPAILVAVLIGLALAGLTSRYLTGWRRHAMLVGGLAVSALLLASSLHRPHEHLTWYLDGLAVLVLVGFVVVVARAKGAGPDDPRRYEAWRGCGPGVFSILALLFAMVLSSAVVVAVADLLNGKNSAASLAGGPLAHATVSLCPAQCHVNDPADLQVPRPYVWFGVMLLPLILLFVALLVLVLIRTRGAATGIPEGAPDETVPEKGRLTSSYPPIRAQVLHARWFAALTHRAERYAGALAVLGGAALVATVAVAVSGWAPRHHTGFGAFVQSVLGAGMWALALVGVTAVGVVAGGPVAGNTRPLGLLWDLVCFLPKAAHPFGPPCYAERVVPELLGRYESWLTGELAPSTRATDTPGYLADRRIVVSAHSLGGVLAVASIFALGRPRAPRSPTDSPPDPAAQPPDELSTISLLTYGCQLRAYFSRILPELLGPRVLGTETSCSATLFTADPWQRTWADERDQRVQARQPGALRQSLVTSSGATRWINLWRRTDYIGFPVVRYRDQGTELPRVDRLAEEVDESRYVLAVLTHSDYQRVAAYAVALDELRGIAPRQESPSPGS